MANVIESTPQRLALKSGSTTWVFDKAAGSATLQRKVMFVALKPVSVPLSDVADVTLHTVIDGASHAEIEHAMVKLRAGGAWVLAANDKPSAQAAVNAVREFLAMPPA